MRNENQKLLLLSLIRNTRTHTYRFTNGLQHASRKDRQIISRTTCQHQENSGDFIAWNGILGSGVWVRERVFLERERDFRAGTLLVNETYQCFFIYCWNH